MSKLRPLVREVRGNALWDGIKYALYIVGGALMSTGALATLIRFLSTIPLDVLLIIGIFVLSLFSIGIATLVARRRQPKNGLSERTPKDMLSTGNTVCPDKWLHDIAEDQRQAIDKWVRVNGCGIHAHELLREDAYVEFIFYVHNDSVYRIYIADNLSGSISFGSRQLNGQMRWRENPIKDMAIGSRSYFVIQQRLSKEDVIYILNSTRGSNRFDFAGLHVTVKGSPDFEDRVVPKRLNIYPPTLPHDELLNNYPKLNIEIIQGTYRGYWDGHNVSDRALLVNVYIRLTNLRPAQVEIRKFKLATEIHDKAYVAYAESGDIHEGRVFNDSGVTLLQGRKLKNLNPPIDSPLTVEHEQAYDGWLQFVLNDRGYDEDEPDPLPATLTAIDIFGEVHPEECQLRYKT